MADISLELRNMSKRFGAVQALDDAHLTARGGEVHALLGENGAGKSTLMHIAYGLERPDTGVIRIDGVQRTFANPRAARQHGIGLVHQHFTSIAALTVAENIALFAGWGVTPRKLKARVLALCEELQLPLDPDARTESLPVALRQRLELAQALATNARILLLDEPTAVLAPSEVDALLERLRGFAAAGRAVVLITHKLDEALRVADRVTVLRRGRVVLESVTRWLDGAKLADAMIGVRGLPKGATGATGANEARGANGGQRGDAAPSYGDIGVRVDTEPRIRAANLHVLRDDRSTVALEDASLEVGAGEIVAVAGIEGNGQRELLRALAGLMGSAGTLHVSRPIAFVPEDRTTEALILSFNLTENVVLGAGPSQPWRRGIRLDWQAAARRTGELLSEFDVRAPGPQVLAATLSGGNQQKLVLARALERRPAVLIAENPTRGLDIAATAAVHQRLREAAEQGVAVLVYSSDLDEIIELGQRVVVAARGRLIEAPAGADKAAIGGLMLGAWPTWFPGEA